MDKQEIIDAIKTTAKANGGAAVGTARFENETGIKPYIWQRFWSRWSDALREAGLEANQLKQPINDNHFLDCLVKLTRHLGRIPTERDLRLARENDEGFPSVGAFQRFGAAALRAKRVIAFCEANPGHDDVLVLWQTFSTKVQIDEVEADDTGSVTVGYVYLVKHGTRREYRIGCTENPLRREGQVAIELPEMVEPVHRIKTDDRFGVEAYWHNRFSSKRIRPGSDWFALTPADVRAFKRWTRIY